MAYKEELQSNNNDLRELLNTLRESGGQLQEKTIEPSTSVQEIVPDSNYDGLSKVTVGAVKLQEKSVSPSASAQTITPDSGYDGLNKVTVNAVTNLSAGNIKKGVVVGGVTGSFTADADATAAQILSGKIAYVAGAKITGSMADNGAVTQSLTTTGASYTIPAGYHNGSGKVTTAITNLTAANIKSGVTVGGVAGTYDPSYTNVSASITPVSVKNLISSVTISGNIITLKLRLDTSVTATITLTLS